MLRKKRQSKYGKRGAIGPSWRFTWDEVACNDGVGIPTRYLDEAVRQGKALNKLRRVIAKHYGVHTKDVYIRVNSWYRTPAYNEHVGGKSNSRHLVGDATDITVTVRTVGFLEPKTVARLATAVPEFENGGIGVYPMFTHLDSRGYKARW